MNSPGLNDPARAKVLQRIKRAINAPESALWGRDERLQQEWRRIQRDFRRTGTLSRDDRIALFRSRLDDYGAPSRVVASQEVSAAVFDVLRGREKRRMIAGPNVPEDWLPPEIEFVRDADLSNQDLEQIGGVVTGCTVAIALTGTIILSARQDGRRALTLVPDYELCIVGEQQIVELVPEAIQKLEPVATTPLTLFSGPSATADIEMNRVQGVHGPRTLDVIIHTD